MTRNTRPDLLLMMGGVTEEKEFPIQWGLAENIQDRLKFERKKDTFSLISRSCYSFYPN